MSDTQALKDPSVFPLGEALEGALKNSYSAYTEFVKRLPEYGIMPEWRYYNDGKAWLSKNVHKKKTVFWLSVWDGFFKVSLFFTERASGGVSELPVAEAFKTFQPVWGGLKPLVICVRPDTDMDDLFKVIEYKRDLK